MRSLLLPRKLTTIFKSKMLCASLAASVFWYVSLFPGRLGSDPALALGIIQKGESTDWWTAMFFWFLRITTFGGTSIWLASLISIVVMYFAIVYFVRSLPENKARQDLTILLICLSPLFGNFAVNINHDIFFSAGILTLMGYCFRIYFCQVSNSSKYIPYLFSIYLLNSRTGYFVEAAFIICSFFMKDLIYSRIRLIFFIFLAFFLSTIGVTKTEIPLHLLPALADIKCVVQHPEARISSDEWKYLENYWDQASWTSPTTCSSMDSALEHFPNAALTKIELKPFLHTYSSLVLKNPAIVIQAHLQRASVALPPPFFQGPQNQVSTNISEPIGFGTNIALQRGPSVLHPSIDIPELKTESKLIKPLEGLALFGSFLINQASWFWGWGGLWLWPIFFYIILRTFARNIRSIMWLSFPILVTHLFLLAFSPIPAPRYVMSSILVGNILLILLVTSALDNLKARGGTQ